MKSRLTLATLAAAAAFVALPTSSQAGGLGLDRMRDCLFGWMRHDRHAAPVKAERVKVKKVKKAAARPMK